MLSLGGHIGAKASALIDGQLPPDEEERAWSHVLACPGCRHVVEREGWIKRQLGTLSDRAALPDRLMGSLYDVDASAAWADVDVIERRSVRRRTAAVVVGSSAVGACALALMTVTGAPAGRPDTPSRTTPANVSGGVWVPTGAVAPSGADPTPFHGWTRRSR
jgi:hypothetical protein